MTPPEHDIPEGFTRRGFLLGGLAAALTVTAAGTTGLAVAGERGKRKPNVLVVPVMGSYTISNARTGCRVTVTVANGVRTITSNGLPNTAPGSFPNANCPNSIAAQSYSYALPTTPTKTTDQEVTVPQPFGIAVDGVLFHPRTAEYWNNDPSSGWNYYALGGGRNLGIDRNHAHVQPDGAYHYHGIPDGLVASMNPKVHAPLVGWAGDGFPIYTAFGYADPTNPKSAVRAMRSSYRLKPGTRPSGPGGPYNGWFNADYEYVPGAGDLDAANGRMTLTPEYPAGTYAYFLTAEFPSVPNLFAGAVAPTFVRTGGGAPPSGGGPSGGPPSGGPPSGGPPSGRPPAPPPR